MTIHRWWRDVVSGSRGGAMANAARGLLALGEPLYAAAVARKNAQFDSGKRKPTAVGVPVISVGNLTVGGTGKTPMVVWLARWFRQRGVEVTIISRGYGAKSGKPNDEYQEIAAQLPEVPHLQNPDRIAAAQQALARQPKQVLVLDDAFQHRRIARDLDLVLLDALDPFGGGRLLPRGLLREPTRYLQRAHAVALSRADAVDRAARDKIRNVVAGLAPGAIWLELEHRPTALLGHADNGREIPVESLRGQPVAAFCGIGNPAGFFHTLAACGAEVVARREYPDHFAYPDQELASLERWAADARTAELVICTHKDLVKIPRSTLAGKPLYALRIEATVREGASQLEEKLEQLAARLTGEGSTTGNA